MSDDDKREDPEVKSGVVIRPGPLPLVATGQQNTLRRLLSRLSLWPFSNRRYVESLKTAKEVFDARSELGEAVGKHEEIRDRLKHFGTVLERGGEERSRQLFEEKERRRAAENIFKQEEKMQEEKNRLKEEELEIQKMELEKRKTQLQKDLDELTKPPPPPEPKKKTTRGRSEKQKLREEVLTRYDKEIARIEAMNKTAKMKATLTKAAEAEKEKALEEIENMP